MEKTSDFWGKFGFGEAFPPFLQAIPYGQPVLHTNCFVRLSLCGAAASACVGQNQGCGVYGGSRQGGELATTERHGY